MRRIEHWVFLGDSLTEGIGRDRVSYVSELAQNLRGKMAPLSTSPIRVGYFRVRKVQPDAFNKYISVNFAGLWEPPAGHDKFDLIVWNLGAEATTTADDIRWLTLLKILNPKLIVVMRGALESIVRPRSLQSGCWPWWVPSTWRDCVSMDPRCYFSGPWWRVTKQRTVDLIKQRLRLRMLADGGAPMHAANRVFENYVTLLDGLKECCANIAVCGLLPVSDKTFPGSSASFRNINQGLRKIAERCGAHFINWEELLGHPLNWQQLLYRDGFHPNMAGAKLIGQKLSDHLFQTVGVQSA